MNKKKFEKTLVMKRVNIYMSLKDKEKLEEIKNKYHVSLSTIAEKTAITLLTNLKKEKIDELINKFYTKKEISKLHKSTIKPKWYVNLVEGETPIKLFTNALHHYTTKLEELDLNNNEKTKILSKINTELQKQKEVYWNLNYIIRTTKRAQRILANGK